MEENNNALVIEEEDLAVIVLSARVAGD